MNVKYPFLGHIPKEIYIHVSAGIYILNNKAPVFGIAMCVNQLSFFKLHSRPPVDELGIGRVLPSWSFVVA